MFQKFVRWLAAPDIAAAKLEGYTISRDEIASRREANELFEMKEYLGKKVITFSNEWEDLIIGTVIKIEYITQANQPILIIEDCFSKMHYMSFGQIYLFEEETLNALLKLNPYERWNLKVSHAPVRWDKQVTGAITPPDQFRAKLETIGYL